jgi:hypothetical protein
MYEMPTIRTCGERVVYQLLNWAHSGVYGGPLTTRLSLTWLVIAEARQARTNLEYGCIRDSTRGEKLGPGSAASETGS